MHIQHVQAMPMPTPTLQLCIPIRMRLALDEGEGQIRTVPVINYWDSDLRSERSELSSVVYDTIGFSLV